MTQRSSHLEDIEALEGQLDERPGDSSHDRGVLHQQAKQLS